MLSTQTQQIGRINGATASGHGKRRRRHRFQAALQARTRRGRFLLLAPTNSHRIHPTVLLGRIRTLLLLLLLLIRIRRQCRFLLPTAGTVLDGLVQARHSRRRRPRLPGQLLTLLARRFLPVWAEYRRKFRLLGRCGQLHRIGGRRSRRYPVAIVYKAERG
uniref:(northern house mosquito) hypothetical protein n=1 Tax=Culex pipiens TaxID=7175 RepID=A0A8D8AP86_CULPI